MHCPFCDVTGHVRMVHAHLATTHGERVTTTEKREPILMLSYELACPRCETKIKRLVNPRGRDPRFLEEHAAEIRLVAFDQLLYHLEAVHGESVEG